MSNRAREIITIEATSPVVKRLRVAGYARVSSDSDEQAHSFSVQVRYYTNYISSHRDWELVDVYADEGISGTSTENRTDFNRMIADCKDGKIDRIITKSTARFSRNTMDSIRIIRKLKELGVTVFFEKENLDTANLTGENLLTLYSTFAQQESMSISENVRKGNRMRMSKGDYVSANPPYGYRLIDNSLKIHEEEAKIIKRIFNDYLMGKGCIAIADELTAERIPRKGGYSGRWRDHVIAYILRNERYAGDMLMQKYYSEEVLPYKQQINRGQLPQYYVRDTHQPIISRIEFEMANILINQRSEIVNKNTNSYSLSKKIVCDNCGSVYRRKQTKGKLYWVCRNHDYSADNCSAQRLTQDAIYEAFVRMYNKLKSNSRWILDPLLAKLEKLREHELRDNPGVTMINKQIAELSEQNHRMSELMSSGILDSALFISQTDELNRKITGLKQAKGKLNEKSRVIEQIDLTKDLIDALADSPEQITAMDKEIFADIVTKIIAHDKVAIKFELINGMTLTERL